MSEHETVRAQMLDALRDQLEGSERASFEQHLAGCAECRGIFEREKALDRALNKRPMYALPKGLEERLRAQVSPKPAAKPKPSWASRRPAMVAFAAVPLLAVLLFVRAWTNPNQELVGEAVNDHLRVLYAEHPIEIASGGIHQVKPWFTGRVDFAPPVTFSGDDEFPMEGGSIALFVDRKAATFVFHHKLHTITLFVFRSEGLNFPMRNNVSLGSLSGTATSLRGFNTLLWRDGDLGYALVSDVNADELVRLANKVNAH